MNTNACVLVSKVTFDVVVSEYIAPLLCRIYWKAEVADPSEVHQESAVGDTDRPALYRSGTSPTYSCELEREREGDREREREREMSLPIFCSILQYDAEEEERLKQAKKQAKLDSLEQQWKAEQQKSSSWWFWSPFNITFPSSVLENLQVSHS